MPKINNIFKNLLEIPIILYYMLCKSAIAPMLWALMIVGLIAFGLVIKG